MAEKPTSRQQKHWEDVLAEHNLGLDRGRAGKNKYGERRLVFVGDGTDLTRIESQELVKKTGRKKPKGRAD